MSTTVRVSETTRAHAARLAAETQEPIGIVIEQALAEFERARFWRDTADALRAVSIEDEYVDWDRSARDGLDRD